MEKILAKVWMNQKIAQDGSVLEKLFAVTKGGDNYQTDYTPGSVSINSFSFYSVRGFDEPRAEYIGNYYISPRANRKKYVIEAMKPCKVLFQSLEKGDKLCHPSGTIRTFEQSKDAWDFLEMIGRTVGRLTSVKLMVWPSIKF